MKDQTQITGVNSSNITAQLQKSYSDKELRCAGDNIAQHACLNQQCYYQNAFICLKEDCQCNQCHSSCLKLLFKSFNENLIDKVIPLKQLEIILCQKVDIMIDMLSSFRQTMIDLIRNKFNHHGLTRQDQSVLKFLQQKSYYKINGNLLWNIHLKIKKQNYAVQLTKTIHRQIITLCDKYKIQTNNYIKSCYGKLGELKNKTFYKLQQKEKAICSQSTIVKTKQLKQNLYSFFEQYLIQQMELIYRATQNGFSVQKFHLKCDFIQNTLIICQTESGNVIGGFTPIVWSPQSAIINDDSNRSFMFSLTKNDKFLLQKGKQAVLKSKTQGPCFGGESPDLCIRESANYPVQNKHSFANFNQSYLNQNYIKGDHSSHSKFNGSWSPQFKLKQWEVWAIIFKQN